MMRRATRTSAVTRSSVLVSGGRSLGSTRDKQRNQSGGDLSTGSQMQVVESPDLTPHLQFSMNALEHVRVPEISEERRRRSDIEKDREMRRKFGKDGPGERLTKSSPQTRKDMLEEQQDIDGLPWEVRWKKSLIPTTEEIVQDIRDRFDLYVQDPIEREQEWYLHWKDRGFKVQKDRMIWPQGYTDYLDHYDENGRRRVLPSDQRWTDSSWKHLADTNYKDRMWLIEGEERKAVHKSLQTQQALIEEEETRQMEMADVYHGLTSGVVDMDPDQAYQALSGTADPLEVAKTKMKIITYGAGEAGRRVPADPSEIDPISGFPRSDLPPLPTGVTVEQGAAIAAQAAMQNEIFEQKAETARLSGSDPTTAYMKAYHESSKKHGDKPGIRTQVEGSIEQVKQLQQQQERIERGNTTPNRPHVGDTMAQIETSLLQESVETPSKSGFIEIEKRPASAEPHIPQELYRVPQTESLSEMPEWYRETLVETQPLIKTYGMVHDPIEEQPAARVEYYQPTPLTEDDRALYADTAPDMVSAFDEVRVHKVKTLPELVEGYKPLPLFNEISKDGTLESGAEAEAAPLLGKDGKPLKKSERLRRERLEKVRKAKVKYDHDIMLPSLPWESDSIVDPYRGVEKAELAIPFEKEDLEKTWRVYREQFQQNLTEFGNLSQVTSEDRCEQLLFDAMAKFRQGQVADHPEVDELHEEVFKIIFEAHTKHFLADFYKCRGNRMTESNTIKAEADEMLRKASAKSKLLGQDFMNFVQEMTSLELDTIRKNPIQRYCVMVRDKKYEPLTKQFTKWMSSELGPFTKAEYKSPEQVETHREFLVRHLNDARARCPARIEGVPDGSRDAVVEAFYQWCRGALCFFSGKKYMSMYVEHADTRFRGKAEEAFEDSWEWFSNYAKASNDLVQIPIPDSDPFYEYDEKEFLDGENAVYAEIRGLLDKAEGIWHTGSSKRWYPLVDETEYMWFNERRGRISIALDISDRCLEHLNKKTHPSIHPFPERARPFLEGAPLTQETAEHLWLRHMGDIYHEHSEMMFRLGRYQTGADYRDKCLKLYHLAIRTARERLPLSWRAPLLTEAKYMMRVYQAGGDCAAHLQEMETVVEKLFLAKEPRHWVEPFSDLPQRVALVHANVPAYGERITMEVRKQLDWQPSSELLARNMEQRSRGGGTLPELEKYFETVNTVADEVFRKKILKWRAKEVEGSDPYLFWTHLYFSFRVYPKNREEVQQMWDMYEPTYEYIYTQCALACRVRGQRLISDCLRRMCQILLPGDAAQKKLLHQELTKVREMMSHMVDRVELDRTINALDAHRSNPSQPPYIYGTSLLVQEATMMNRIHQNPLLRNRLGLSDYEEIRRRTDAAREANLSSTPQDAARQQSKNGNALEEEPLTAREDPSTKDMFNA